jgi:hypothetical protein
MGGSTVCVTEGVVSRVDAHLYVHARSLGLGGAWSPGNLPILQIDAAINPGNSGGPTFDKTGAVVGVASSGMSGMAAQNVGYIIPIAVVRLFVDEFARTGAWSGVSETGLRVQELESDAMRAYLQMGDRTGVRVKEVAPLGAAASEVEKGDILLAVDGAPLSNEATVAITLGTTRVDVPWDAVVTQKPKGEATKLTLLRGGAVMEKTVCFRPLPPLSPRFDRYDADPEYVLIGGFVFTKMTVPLIMEMRHAMQNGRGARMSPGVVKAMSKWKKGDEEIVLLISVLRHRVNRGYDVSTVRIVESVNGKEVPTLKAFADATAEPSGAEFLRIRFAGDDHDALVLRAADLAAADKELLRRNKIASARELRAKL